MCVDVEAESALCRGVSGSIVITCFNSILDYVLHITTNVTLLSNSAGKCVIPANYCVILHFGVTCKVKHPGDYCSLYRHFCT